ncbi:DinB family protein [Silvibacterium sp.]|uniref:DinB family protein n=1 Tax=Silvibacterium sp. TaxID=1964179 RepID=UPI0039E3C94B
MNELQRNLVSDGYGAPPARILEALTEQLAHTPVPGAPHTIYEELWHLAFWLELSLDWITGQLTPYPPHSSEGFPAPEAIAAEPFAQLLRRFLDGLEIAFGMAGDEATLARKFDRPSRTGTLRLTVEDELLGLATHDAYHLGRIVLLRQLLGAWPPPAGGDSW